MWIDRSIHLRLSGDLFGTEHIHMSAKLRFVLKRGFLVGGVAHDTCRQAVEIAAVGAAGRSGLVKYHLYRTKVEYRHGSVRFGTRDAGYRKL